MKRMKKALAALAFLALTVPAMASEYGHWRTLHYSYQAGCFRVTVCVTWNDYNCSGMIDSPQEVKSIRQVSTKITRWGGYDS